jgi:hypothetical protein
MCEKENSPIVATRQASAALVADLLRTAEKELSASYTAILSRYGPEEARRAAYGWIEEMKTMDWPLDGVVPNWRHVSIIAADWVASRIVEQPSNLWQPETAQLASRFEHEILFGQAVYGLDWGVGGSLFL